MAFVQRIIFRSSEQYKPGDVVIKKEDIAERIKELALDIAKDFAGKRLLVIGILKGAFILTADLARELHTAGLTDFEVSFMTVKSYRAGTTSSGVPDIKNDLDIDCRNRGMLLVDDIFDTGKSIQAIHKKLIEQGARSVKSLVLLSKPGRKEVSYTPDYVGFSIPNLWVEGYGMDTNEYGRGEPNIIIGV